VRRLRIHTADTSETAAAPTGVDLLTGPIRLARGGYQPATTTEGGGFTPRPYEGAPTFSNFERVVEVIDVIGVGTQEELIAAEAEIQELLDQARLWFLNPVQVDSVWLEWTVNGEETDTISYEYGAKRALIYRGRFVLNMPDRFDGGFLNSEVFGQIVIERSAFWENCYRKSSGFTGGPSGELIDISSLQAYRGTVPARLAALSVSSFADYATDFWVGIRSEGMGDTDFEPVWECEDGTNGTDASDAVDATASGGDKVTVSFSSSESLEERMSITIDEAHSGSDSSHFVGRYLVLARCKVGSSTVCGLKMFYGYSATPYGTQEEIYIDNTVWQLVELGEVQFPPHRTSRYIASWLDNMDDITISLHAERISGSGSLDLDCLILIPSEHLLTIKDLGDGATLPVAALYTLEDGTQVLFDALISPSVELYSQGQFSARNWVLPGDCAFMVTAFQRAGTAHSLTDAIDVTVEYYPRWKIYRARA
jgi:hypothetical protein